MGGWLRSPNEDWRAAAAAALITMAHVIPDGAACAVAAVTAVGTKQLVEMLRSGPRLRTRAAKALALLCSGAGGVAALRAAEGTRDALRGVLADVRDAAVRASAEAALLALG